MLPANLGSVQEPTVVEVLSTSIWDTSSNMIKTKIAKLKFDPRSTEDTTQHCVTLSSSSYIAIADEIFKVCVT